MSLSEEQIALEKKIQKSARTWGIVLGVIAGVLTLSLVSGLNTFVWAALGAAVGIAVGFGIYKWRYGAKSGAAKCEKCNAAFSISQTDKTETLAGSAPEESREEQEDGSTKVKNWIEEQYDVVETYTCSKCANETLKEYKSTRRKDEKETIEPAPKSGEAGQSKSGAAPSKTAATSNKGKPAQTRTGKSQKGGDT